MDRKTVTSTEFRIKAGQYLDDAAKAPVFITKHHRVTRVLIDIDEYERLSKAAARRAKLEAAQERSHAQFGPLYEKLAR